MSTEDKADQAPELRTNETDDDDTEGHRLTSLRTNETEDDDTEGHAKAKMDPDFGGKAASVVTSLHPNAKDDDDDVEGHSKKA